METYCVVFNYGLFGWNISLLLANFIHTQVALRIRPLNEAEIEEGAAVVAQRVDDQVGFVKLVHRGNRCVGKCCVTETDRYLKTNSFTI